MHKHLLDEKRRDLVIFEEKREALVEYIRNLEMEFKKEQQFIAGVPERAYTFEKYAQQVKVKKADAAKQIGALDKEIEFLSEQISEAFGEIKKYEIIKEKKEEAAEKDILHKAQIDLDEMAGMAYTRKQDAAQ
jgi:flagellar biosynthesis chaperone FliJ